MSDFNNITSLGGGSGGGGGGGGVPDDNSVTTIKIVNGAVTSAKIAAALSDPVAATAGLRTLGTGAQQATAGNDSRVTGAIQSSLLTVDGDLLTRTAGVPARIARSALPVTSLGVGTATSLQAIRANSGATALEGVTLGGAAVLNVGTAAGTVAAGDDSRITGAIQATTLTTNGQLLTRTSGAPAPIERSAIGVTELGIGTATALQAIRVNAGGSALEGVANGNFTRATPPLAASIAADAGQLYVEEFAGLEVPGAQNADDIRALLELRLYGLRYEYQPNPPSGAAGLPTAASGGAVLGAAFGLPSGATAAHPALTLPGTIITSAPRSVITGTAALANGAGVFMSAIGFGSAVFHRGTVGTRRGGFWHEFDFSTDSFANGTRRGVGFTSQLVAADPPSLQNSFMIGWGQTYTDGFWHFMRRTGSGTLVDLALDGTLARPAWLGGGVFPAMPRNNTSRYRGRIIALPGRDWMGIRVWDVESGAIYLEGRYDTDLPAVETGLYAIHDANTGTLTTPAVVMNIFRINGWIGGT